MHSFNGVSLHLGNLLVSDFDPSDISTADGPRVVAHNLAGLLAADRCVANKTLRLAAGRRSTANWPSPGTPL
jgi:hypothetical protein